ncbi:hypothetical protein D039_2863B, partial [Vibrio parahaemolyticus EKP-028]
PKEGVRHHLNGQF